jgi:hypothetical protein
MDTSRTLGQQASRPWSIAFFLYIGFFDGGTGAFAANLLIAEIAGVIGAVVGLITGLVQAVRGEHLL